MKGMIKIKYIPLLILVLLFLTRFEKDNNSKLPTDGAWRTTNSLTIGAMPNVVGFSVRCIKDD